jgi:3-oxoacid CoA-transferase subunit A
MIKNWLIRGDTHGNFLWMTKGSLAKYQPEETAIIILGDAGFDFYLNETDERKKKEVENRGYYIYWLRGNHEARPQELEEYEKIFDENVKGIVYYNPRYPHLRAFLDYGFYDINNYSCLVIGGAYSVDKYYRLQRAILTEKANDPKKTGWWANEQLNAEEMADCSKQIKLFIATGKQIDFVLTHTCPLDYQPTDLFLGFIDQSTVDNSMEIWMNQIKDILNWNIWCFGHYHADRVERPHVEQYYNDIEEMDEIYNRWERYDQTGEFDWWINKSPNFYLGR